MKLKFIHRVCDLVKGNSIGQKSKLKSKYCLLLLFPGLLLYGYSSKPDQKALIFKFRMFSPYSPVKWLTWKKL